MIVIGDVHGCIKTLKALVEKLPKDQEIVFVGDLIDRGPDSAQVVEFVRTNNYRTVKGNHEEMAIQGLDTANWKDYNLWIQNGGLATIESYKQPENKHLTIRDDVEYFKTLPLYIDYEMEGQRYVISHSHGPIKYKNVSVKSENTSLSYLWSRYMDEPEDYINIIGHTPTSEQTRILNKHSSTIIVDSGAVFKSAEHYGVLTAYEIETGKFYMQENIEGSTNAKD